MSSLAAACADGYYRNPEAGEGKRGKDGMKKATKSTIRFELPFNCWCAGCERMLGKGKRFNAELVIETDPKICDYVIVAGGRQKVETFSAADAGVLELRTKEEKKVLQDPLRRLEHRQAEKARSLAEHKRLRGIQDMNEAAHLDDYSRNKAMRRSMRAQKKSSQAIRAQALKMGMPSHVRLLPETKADRVAAASVQFGESAASVRKRRRNEIRNESIFGSGTQTPKPKGKSVQGKTHEFCLSVRRSKT